MSCWSSYEQTTGCQENDISVGCAVLETCILLGHDFMYDISIICLSSPVVFSQFTEGSSQGEEGFTALGIDGPPRKRYLHMAVMHTLIRSQDLLYILYLSFLTGYEQCHFQQIMNR